MGVGVEKQKQIGQLQLGFLFFSSLCLPLSLSRFSILVLTEIILPLEEKKKKMRNSLRKLGGLGGRNKQGDARDRRDRRLQQSLAQIDEIERASQDMNDMRDCYDTLLSAAAATANSAYEFAESLKEMGACLLEKTALNEDEESGKVLLMLGKVQFELQKLVDNYRSHILQTITSPSESLLNELQIVEEMKRQCDHKRSVYEDMRTKQRERGRLKSKRGESFSSQQLQAAQDDYDEEATLFVFRLKSLKQGQSRSLLTQAARHHAAQLCFARKAVKSLEAVEPHVKFVSEQQHIDYKFSGLEDDGGDNGDYDDTDDDDDDDDDGSYYGDDDGELSFDYGQNDQGKNVVSTPRDSIEGNLERNLGGDFLPFGREPKASSQSAPLSAGKKFDPAERSRQIQPLSARKSTSYKLPTPAESKSPVFTGPDTPASQGTSWSSSALNYRHSSPLEKKRYEKNFGNEKLSGPIVPTQPSVLRESNNNTSSTSLPAPLTEELSSQQHAQHSTSDAKKIKRQAFSGPLKSWPNKPGLYASGPIVSKGVPPKLFSGPLLRTPIPQPSSSPKVSPSASPTFVSSPKISELHELPRPPANLAAKSAGRPSNQIGYSVPLVSRGQETPAVTKLVSNAASPLPKPPFTVSRSFSTPSRGQRVTLSPVLTPLGALHTSNVTQHNASPTLTSISSSSIQPASPTS